MDLSDIDHNTREAIKLVDAFITAVAIPTWAQEETLAMAIEHLTKEMHKEPREHQGIFAEFIHYLQEHRNGEL